MELKAMSPLTAEIFHLFTKKKKIQFTLEGTFLCELNNDRLYLNSSFLPGSFLFLFTLTTFTRASN